MLNGLRDIGLTLSVRPSENGSQYIWTKVAGMHLTNLVLQIDNVLVRRFFQGRTFVSESLAPVGGALAFI